MSNQELIVAEKAERDVIEITLFINTMIGPFIGLPTTYHVLENIIWMLPQYAEVLNAVWYWMFFGLAPIVLICYVYLTYRSLWFLFSLEDRYDKLVRNLAIRRVGKAGSGDLTLVEDDK